MMSPSPSCNASYDGACSDAPSHAREGVLSAASADSDSDGGEFDDEAALLKLLRMRRAFTNPCTAGEEGAAGGGGEGSDRGRERVSPGVANIGGRLSRAQLLPHVSPPLSEASQDLEGAADARHSRSSSASPPRLSALAPMADGARHGAGVLSPEEAQQVLTQKQKEMQERRQVRSELRVYTYTHTLSHISTHARTHTHTHTLTTHTHTHMQLARLRQELSSLDSQLAQHDTQPVTVCVVC